MKAKPNPPIEVNLEELDRIIDGGMRAPLSEADVEKLKNALHALAKRVTPRLRSTEKSRDVIAGDNSVPAAKRAKPVPKGHGRNSAAEYTGAERIKIRQESLQPGDRCTGMPARKSVSATRAAHAHPHRGTSAAASDRA